MSMTARVPPRQAVALGVALGCFAVDTRAQTPVVVPHVHQAYVHDRNAFTQGLVYWRGDLYESTGLYGRSSLRRVDIGTGSVELRVELPESQFGEGLALVDDRLVQLTWKEGVANVYAMDTFRLLSTYIYSGEGWGLCFDGKKLVMSDGTSSLYFRNAETFELESSVSVERNGQPLRQLNELECVNGFVYANVWQSEEIVKIDPTSGQVAATIRVRDLLTSSEKAGTDVLNGIAYNPDTRRFYITGKLWPKLFEVDFPGEADPHFASGTSGDSNTNGGPTTSLASPSDRDAASEPATTTSTLPSPARVANGCRCTLAKAEATMGVWALLAVMGALVRRKVWRV